jgi:F420-non-reducing hydrogenase iron-sulfur subunit
MCTGRIDLAFVFRSFLNGADGVFVGGCKLGECNYITQGNYQALAMVYLSKQILEHIGINPERLRIDFMSSGEGIRFAEVMNEYGKKIKELGPLGKSEGLKDDDLKAKLEEVIKLIPYIKISEREKLASKLNTIDDYKTLFSSDEVARLLGEVTSYYIDPKKCQACGTCLRRCPMEAIDGGKNKVHIIIQDKCIRCGTCFENCPPKFKSIVKLVGEPVPPPVPEEARTVVRQAKEK